MSTAEASSSLLTSAVSVPCEEWEESQGEYCQHRCVYVNSYVDMNG